VSAPRVISGRYGGRSIKVPRGSVTRPTGARVREALFNVLGDVRGTRVLDLYAGSGALAIEALSRGAAHAVLVENERAALGCIRENLISLGASEHTVVVPQRLPRALTGALAHAPFDLVLCDPPWADIEGACTVLALLAHSAGLAPRARVVLEHSAKDAEPNVSGLEPSERRRWGDTAVSLFLAPLATI